MTRATMLMLLCLLASCQNCGPTQADYHGCAASCGKNGVRSVTFVKCECDVAASDAGSR